MHFNIGCSCKIIVSCMPWCVKKQCTFLSIISYSVIPFCLSQVPFNAILVSICMFPPKSYSWWLFSVYLFRVVFQWKKATCITSPLGRLLSITLDIKWSHFMTHRPEVNQQKRPLWIICVSTVVFYILSYNLLVFNANFNVLAVLPNYSM